MPKSSRRRRGRSDGSSTRILITGASGLLGNKLAALALERGHEVFSAYKEHPPQHGKPIQMDIADEKQAKGSILGTRPQVIINAAAVTDVDRCEDDPDLAFLVNATAVRHLAEAAREVNAFFVQLSTDYVFDGAKGNYSENDIPHPASKYGQSKLEGELASKAAGEDRCCVARTSVVYGWGRAHRPNAATYIYEKLGKGEKVSMVRDQFSSPTLNTSLAEMILGIVEHETPGVLHVAGATRLGRYDFALRLADVMGLPKSLISAVDANQIQWKAKRPRDSSLDVSKATRVLTRGPIQIQEALKLFREQKGP